MNKAELVAAVAEKAGLSKKDSEKAINAAFDSITAALAGGEKVQLVGFGGRRPKYYSGKWEKSQPEIRKKFINYDL